MALFRFLRQFTRFFSWFFQKSFRDFYRFLFIWLSKLKHFLLTSSSPGYSDWSNFPLCFWNLKKYPCALDWFLYNPAKSSFWFYRAWNTHKTAMFAKGTEKICPNPGPIASFKRAAETASKRVNKQPQINHPQHLNSPGSPSYSACKSVSPVLYGP